MGNLAITYQHIADILSFQTPNNELEKNLSHPNFNWDSIVIEGSKHLVLPAIYCRLKTKNLLHILPEDLHTYLDEITRINRNRNKSIFTQIQTLSQLLKKHNINHVFLKGSALLILECYNDGAERMIGDIDILIKPDQVELAYKLLLNNEYYPLEQSLRNKFFEHKHLQRLKNDKFICAVELHHRLFNTYKDNDINCDNILNRKQKKQNTSIPSISDLIKHNILNYQINDKGKLYNNINFRSAYDSLSLLKREVSLIEGTNDKIYKNYYNTIGLFFKEISKTIKIDSNFQTSFYLFKLKHIKFYKFWHKLLTLMNLFPNILKRLYYFLINNSYRNAVINDRKRIYKYFKSILTNSKAFL